MNKDKLKLYWSILTGKYETEHYEESWKDFWQAIGILILLVGVCFLILCLVILIANVI